MRFFLFMGLVILSLMHYLKNIRLSSEREKILALRREF
jgi:hypothetical protein